MAYVSARIEELFALEESVKRQLESVNQQIAQKTAAAEREIEEKVATYRANLSRRYADLLRARTGYTRRLRLVQEQRMAELVAAAIAAREESGEETSLPAVGDGISPET